MAYFQELYTQLLSYFPGFLHPVISIALAALIIYAIFQTARQNFIYIIVLVILLPASIPILKSVVDSVVSIIKFLLGQG